MYDISVDELVKKTGSLYKLVLLSAKRTIELAEGATKLIDAPVDTKMPTIALREIMQDKVTFKLKEKK
ncbi:MAG: DNA-directed RNA polymerase subunit omega [Candidatus Omnitrophica bacterium]|nr:DNA-directed RNA polymerase subunit omega [Candidatus Omnitrophota bacterium]